MKNANIGKIMTTFYIKYFTLYRFESYDTN